MLVIQPGALGDSILTLPLIRLIRSRWRNDHDLACDMMGHRDTLNFLQGRTDVDQVISMDGMSLHRLFVSNDSFAIEVSDPLALLLNRYDLIITFLSDPEGHFERNLITATIKNRTIDIVTLQLTPPGDYPHHVSRFMIEQFSREMPHSEITVDYDFTKTNYITPFSIDRNMGAQILRQNGVDLVKNVVVLHPGSGGKAKCWPAENFSAMAIKLLENDCEPVMLLGPAEERLEKSDYFADITQIPVIKKLTVDEVLATLSCSQAYIGNDSGISHLAGAMGIPIYVLFGPTKPENWAPLGEKKVIYQSENNDFWPKMTEIWAKIEENITRKNF